MVILTNGDNGSLLIDKLIGEMVNLSASVKEAEVVKLAPDILEHYVGSYLQTDGRTLLIERTGNTLKVSGEGIPLVEIIPQPGNKFFIKTMIRLEFTKDKQGIMKINIFQNDKLVMEAKRI
jgi:hypothetical protein